jgi:Zn-dependent protease with chaperone function
MDYRLRRLRHGKITNTGIGFLALSLSACSSSAHWANLPDQRSDVIAYMVTNDNDRVKPAVGIVRALAAAAPLPVDKIYVFTSGHGNALLNAQAFHGNNAGAFRCGKGNPPPSGCVYVGNDLLEALSIDALAGVLAHELGHLERGHKGLNSDLKSAQSMTRSGSSLCSQPAIGAAAVINLIGCAFALGGLASTATISSYSRDLEREADESALLRLQAAGVKCPALIMQKAFTELSTLPGSTQGGGLFSTHPSLRERWQKASASC